LAKKKLYAVRNGYQPGLYENWVECEAQVKGFPGAEFKGFKTREEALTWLGSAVDVANAEVEDGRTPMGEGERDVSVGKQSASTASGPPWEEDEGLHGPEEIAGTQRVEDTSGALAQAKACPGEKEVDLVAKRQEKASAFVDFLRPTGEEAVLEAGHSEHYHRIAFRQGGFAHLYLTKNKPFDLQFTGFKDKARKGRIERLWRAFHWHGALHGRGEPVDRWQAVEHYYSLLEPFRHLPFDFFALAQALESAADGALSSESVRYDFDRIEDAYRRLRPY